MGRVACFRVRGLKRVGYRGQLMRIIGALMTLSVAGLAFAGAVQANTNPCPGALPRPGATFGGVVRVVLDGDTLCVGEKPYFKTWTKVRLSDFDAPELNRAGGQRAKAALEDIALGRRVVCVSGARSLDRVMARCTIVKKGIGASMRDAGIERGGDR
jgi:endonuclease YncB( thermonuclease family)